MSEMVERVAKAIYVQFEDRPLYAQSQMNVLLAAELARAAIEAMREPTLDMVTAAFEEQGQQSYCDVWDVMIDAALVDPQK